MIEVDEHSQLKPESFVDLAKIKSLHKPSISSRKNSLNEALKLNLIPEQDGYDNKIKRFTFLLNKEERIMYMCNSGRNFLDQILNVDVLKENCKLESIMIPKDSQVFGKFILYKLQHQDNIEFKVYKLMFTKAIDTRGTIFIFMLSW